MRLSACMPVQWGPRPRFSSITTVSLGRPIGAFDGRDEEPDRYAYLLDKVKRMMADLASSKTGACAVETSFDDVPRRRITLFSMIDELYVLVSGQAKEAQMKVFCLDCDDAQVVPHFREEVLTHLGNRYLGYSNDDSRPVTAVTLTRLVDETLETLGTAGRVGTT